MNLDQNKYYIYHVFIDWLCVIAFAASLHLLKLIALILCTLMFTFDPKLNTMYLLHTVLAVLNAFFVIDLWIQCFYKYIVFTIPICWNSELSISITFIIAFTDVYILGLHTYPYIESLSRFNWLSCVELAPILDIELLVEYGGYELCIDPPWFTLLCGGIECPLGIEVRWGSYILSIPAKAPP